MKQWIVAVVLVGTVCLSTPSSADAAGEANIAKPQNRLILLQSTILNAYWNGQYQEIKRADAFYGYGWLDDHRVFVAYQPSGEAEASARTEVIDVAQSRSFSLGEIGGAGESNFDVNPDTKEIIFSDSDGIELMTVDLNNLSNFKLSHRIRQIKKDVGGNPGWGVFWVDKHTIGYLEGKKLVKIVVSQ